LDRLIAAGLLFRQGMPPHATYVFKHALVQDAAYGTLLREPRRRLHARIAETIESELTESAESRPELLTYHWRQGGDSIKAVNYLLMAAERGLYRSATTEALSHLAQARELISDLPKTKDQLQLQLKLEITLARAMLATHGYTASETRKAYRSARGCCEALGDQASLPLIIYGQWLSAWVAADHQSALELAQQLCVWGECNNDSVGLAVGHCALGMTLTTLGRLLDARSHLDQALRINKFVLPGRQPFVASDVDGRISTLSFMHNCLLLLGLPDQAEAAANEVATLKPDNLYSQALAQLRLLRMYAFARDVPATAERGLKLLRLAQEQGYPFMIAIANIYVGWALTQRGEIAGGIESCQNGLAQLQATGANCWLPFHLTLLAECHERAGEHAHAAKAVGEALEAVKTTGEHLWEAEIYRLKGRLLLRAHGDANGAQECFVKAVGIARRQHAKLLELRAAVSLADLLHREPRSADARQVLAPVYDSFTEGFEFIDLREAKACLDSLSD
jgi:tetratricopeptide (TPR) repeat protein